MSSARGSRKGRSKSRIKKTNHTITNSVTRTPKKSRSRSRKKRATTPKARDIGLKCSIFLSKERKNTVVASENPISTKIIESSIIAANELGHYSNCLFDGAHMFEFDKVFTGDKTNNVKFYNKAIKTYTKNLIRGKNSTVLFFGPSNSGKTFTINGGLGNERGIIYTAAEDIFEYIELSNQTGDPLILKVSAYIVYLEKVVDMLSQRKMGVKLDHFLSSSKEEVISKITNLKQKIIPSITEFRHIIMEINRNKKLHTALMKNEAKLDKKFHLVISLKLDKKTDTKFKKFSQMNF